MSKRIFHIILTCIVGLTVMTSAVVPHHHHQGTACFSLDLCEKSPDECEDHHLGSHNHPTCSTEEELPFGEEDQCVLEQFVFFSPTQSRVNLIAPIVDFLPDFFFPAVSAIVKYDLSLPETETQSRQIPYLINDYKTLISRSSGLRAPPVLFV